MRQQGDAKVMISTARTRPKSSAPLELLAAAGVLARVRRGSCFRGSFMVLADNIYCLRQQQDNAGRINHTDP